jgi:ribosomal protein S18 acetylase RimI-like enzyme
MQWLQIISPTAERDGFVKKEILIAGFSVVDLKDDNVWALFVKPEFEDQKIGKQLHNLMLDWYFDQGKQNIWLSTEPNTRAADFYRRQGWKETGTFGKDEIRFEMTAEDWKKSR